MAFSMTQIKREIKSNQSASLGKETRACFKAIHNLFIITPNVQFALDKYLTYRLEQRRGAKLNSDNITKLVQELLEKCCNKEYKDITYKNVLDNEKEIIYQVKKAIYYGATNYIYNPFEDGFIHIDDDKLVRRSIAPPKRFTTEEELTKQKIKDYFGELL